MCAISKRFFAMISATTLLTIPSRARADGNAADFVIFKAIADEDTSSDRAQRGRRGLYKINQHLNKAIDLSLDRYSAGIRQPGRRPMFALKADINWLWAAIIVMDRKQHWLFAAELISREMALERYGKLY